jgi:List-Bact-rpt repeat protein
VLRLLLATALAATVPAVPDGPGYQQAWSLTEGDPGVVIAVVADGASGHGAAAADGAAGVCKLCRVMPAGDVHSAIENGVDVILLADCATPADIAAAFAHGLAVVGCNTLDVGDPPAVAGIVGLMLSCNPSLLPDEIRLILLETAGNAYDAVKRAGCRANPAELVRLLIAVRGRGTVTHTPDDDTYNAGTVIVLRAKPDRGWRFALWDGVCHGRRAVCTVRLLQSGVTTAVFRPAR